ncbi:MAG TPA: diacylglycerol kinase family protein [Thermoleophilaceae bacterium]
MRRRLYAAAALLLLTAAVVIAIVTFIQNFPRGIAVAACLFAAVAMAWWGLVHERLARTLAIALAGALLLGAVLLVVLEGEALKDALVVVAFLLSVSAARQAFATRAELPDGPRPQRAVLFYNPKSGGGKAERFRVADEARARGVEPIELRLGDDLRELVDRAVAGGADALSMAGGDGSQAIVAAAAAEHGLPYACIPSGTRNHFALDLGVDRDDVVGALDALVAGRERVVDLAEVNGRVFVNNVSLGVYAEAVQQEGYRDAKLRTLLDTAPRVLGANGSELDLHWNGPDGQEYVRAAVLLVSNDPYRLGRALGSGTRPRLDGGVLGVAAFTGSNRSAQPPRVEEWCVESFEVRSAGRIAAGVDGEALVFDSPVRFHTRPAALRVLIAPQHPGASPSARLPDTPWGMFGALARMTFGRAAT